MRIKSCSWLKQKPLKIKILLLGLERWFSSVIKSAGCFPRLETWFPTSNGGSQLFVMLFLGDLTASFGFGRHQACMWHTEIHAGKISTCIKKKKVRTTSSNENIKRCLSIPCKCCGWSMHTIPGYETKWPDKTHEGKKLNRPIMFYSLSKQQFIFQVLLHFHTLKEGYILHSFTLYTSQEFPGLNI